MNSIPTLVLGTRNLKKRDELTGLLASIGIGLETLEDYPTAIDVEEVGDSFTANAALKATEQARTIHRWVLGEDSGLAVDALAGAPGIYSARFSGDAATDESNNGLLLERLEGVARIKRTAHYVCHMTVSNPAGEIRAESESRCNGLIRREPVGSGGFGYDPLFEIVEYHRTFGQLGPAVKAALSHRARAAQLLLPQLRGLIADGEWK